MTALAWPLVALVLGVLAFAVAWRAVGSAGRFVTHEQFRATTEKTIGICKDLNAAGDKAEDRIAEQGKRLDALEDLTKRLDARTSNDPALARLPPGLRRGGP